MRKGFHGFIPLLLSRGLNIALYKPRHGVLQRKVQQFVLFARPNLVSITEQVFEYQKTEAQTPGRGYLTKFNTGRLRPVLQPLTLLYTIWKNRYPFYIPFIEKRYPYHIPTLGSLVLTFMKCLISIK